MKKVAFFNSLSFWGGGEKLHLEYALEFKNLGYDTIIFCKKNSPLWIEANKAGLKTFNIHVKPLSFLNLFKIVSIGLIFKRKQIDTVIFSSSQDMKMATVIGHFIGLKRIVYLRGLAVPIKNSFINRIFIKSWITHIVPNSKETLRCMFLNLRNKSIKAKVKVIYHGININDHSVIDKEFVSKIRSKTHGVVLGNAGRLTKQKGQLFLIELAKVLKSKGVDFTLLIAGTGELEEELIAKIKEEELESEILLLGFVNDMNSFMASLDIFLLSSFWEGFGYVIVEAMVQKKPVVAFNISSNPEIITNKKSGFLAPLNSIDDFVEYTQNLISDTELRDYIGMQAKKEVHERFQLIDRIKEFEKFLIN